MLALQGISHSFSPGSAISFKDIEINAGEKILISGNSGSGKTTLLHIAAGLLKPDNGAVIFKGENLYQLKPSEIDLIRGKNFGIIFQKAHLIKNLSVKENLLASMYFAGLKTSKTAALDILKQLNLIEEADKKPYMLSQGQAQRAAVARAVINSPAIIFADEPTSSLDDKNAVAVMEILLECSFRLNAALMISSHDGRLKPYFDNIYFL
jgi:putative ABC transport system ATP-binding protein